MAAPAATIDPRVARPRIVPVITTGPVIAPNRSHATIDIGVDEHEIDAVAAVEALIAHCGDACVEISIAAGRDKNVSHTRLTTARILHEAEAAVASRFESTLSKYLICLTGPTEDRL